MPKETVLWLFFVRFFFCFAATFKAVGDQRLLAPGVGLKETRRLSQTSHDIVLKRPRPV